MDNDNNSERRRVDRDRRTAEFWGYDDDPFYERDHRRRRAVRTESATTAACEAALPPDPDDDPLGLYGGGPEVVALRERAVRELLESPLCPGYPAPREPNVLLHLGSEIRRWVARFFQAL